MFFGKCYPSCVGLFGFFFEGREATEGCGSLGRGCGCGCGLDCAEKKPTLAQGYFCNPPKVTHPAKGTLHVLKGCGLIARQVASFSL